MYKYSDKFENKYSRPHLPKELKIMFWIGTLLMLLLGCLSLLLKEYRIIYLMYFSMILITTPFKIHQINWINQHLLILNYNNGFLFNKRKVTPFLRKYLYGYKSATFVYNIAIYLQLILFLYIGLSSLCFGIIWICYFTGALHENVFHTVFVLMVAVLYLIIHTTIFIFLIISETKLHSKSDKKSRFSVVKDIKDSRHINRIVNDVQWQVAAIKELEKHANYKEKQVAYIM